MKRSLEVTWQDPIELAKVARSMAGIEFLRAMRDGKLPPPPIAQLLGFQLVEVEPGRAVFEVQPGERHYNPIGSVHGGYLASLLDSAVGLAVHARLPAGKGYTTLELKVSYHRAVTKKTGPIRAEGVVTQLGRRADDRLAHR